MAQEQMNIQWYPGHMTKTRRQMEEDLKLVDAVCEIVDARIPMASRNPDIDSICGNKPRIIILNRMDLADPEATKAWVSHFRAKGMAAVPTDCKSRKGINAFTPAVQSVLQEKIKRNEAKGMKKALRVMVVGIPNVGKSTLINQISGRKGAKAENRPGVTRGKQWVTVDRDLLLLDTPGILWPKFDDPNVGMLLAYTGAVKENILDVEELASYLMTLLWKYYPACIKDRYGIEAPEDTPGYELIEMAGKRRGFLLSGGVINTERMSKVLLDEYRSGKLGKFTFEMPPKEEV
jgi:ribosome biogenesis GTPase A